MDNSTFIPSQVVFNVNNGAGRITASSRSAVSMCDGRWRTLVAKKQKHSLSLTVDGVTVTAENPYSSSTSAETKNPIYVGGYPGMEFLSTDFNAVVSVYRVTACPNYMRFDKIPATSNLSVHIRHDTTESIKYHSVCGRALSK